MNSCALVWYGWFQRQTGTPSVYGYGGFVAVGYLVVGVRIRSRRGHGHDEIYRYSDSLYLKVIRKPYWGKKESQSLDEMRAYLCRSINIDICSRSRNFAQIRSSKRAKLDKPWMTDRGTNKREKERGRPCPMSIAWMSIDNWQWIFLVCGSKSDRSRQILRYSIHIVFK